jgi:hypothetical protein
MRTRLIDTSQNVSDHFSELDGLVEITIHAGGQALFMDMEQGICR